MGAGEAATWEGSRLLFEAGESDGGDVDTGEGVHEVDETLLLGFVISGDDDQGLVAGGVGEFFVARKFGFHGGVVDHDLVGDADFAVLSEANFEGINLDVAAGAGVGGELHAEVGLAGFEGGGNEEVDEEEEGDVDQRRDVQSRCLKLFSGDAFFSGHLVNGSWVRQELASAAFGSREGGKDDGVDARRAGCLDGLFRVFDNGSLVAAKEDFGGDTGFHDGLFFFDV